MSSDLLDQEESSKKSIRFDINSKKSKPDLSEAGTSKTDEADPKKSKKSTENDWGFFPPNMWFWKEEEPAENQQEVQLKTWSSTSQDPIINTNIPSEPQSQSQPQESVKYTESQYIWPNAINIWEPGHLVNQPTLDQIIEQSKRRQNQSMYAEDFSEYVDYLGERLSKSKLNVLIAQLNNMLPTSSHKNMNSTKKYIKAKPLDRKKSSIKLIVKESKVSENLSREEITKRELLRQNQIEDVIIEEHKKVDKHLKPEEIVRREQLRQNQIQEYEKLREQIGLFGERRSDVTLQERKEIFLERKISKEELNLYIDQLDEEPRYFRKGQKVIEKQLNG